MIFIKRILPLLVASCILATSCQNSETEKTATIDSTANATNTRMPLAVADVPSSPEYAGASLSLANAAAAVSGDSVKLNFTFNVKNYELASQTADAGSKQCNNSDKGQHIHFILDNKPYAALYEPKHEVTVAKNTEHYLLCFLSRSYHESVKSDGAAFLYHFHVDENGKLHKMDNPATPMVFYSRPKGDYLGKDTENLLLDYYVWNTKLSADGYQVKAHVQGDGVDSTLTLSDWKPLFLKNMPMGKPSITLTLVDKDGNKVNGPETEVTREFNLSKDEPMAK